MGDTVKISATKEGIKFGVSGDIGSGSIICKHANPDDDDDDDEVFASLSLSLSPSRTFCVSYTKPGSRIAHRIQR
jgi:proliferating cell nuclear antigen